MTKVTKVDRIVGEVGQIRRYLNLCFWKLQIKYDFEVINDFTLNVLPKFVVSRNSSARSSMKAPRSIPLLGVRFCNLSAVLNILRLPI